MNCRQTTEKLPLFVGGDLLPAIAARVEEHLERCASCEAERARYEDARRSLFVLKGAVVGPAPDLWPAIRAQLAAPPRRARRPLRIVAAVAAALLVALLGTSQLRSTKPADESVVGDGIVAPENGSFAGIAEAVALMPPPPASAPVRREFILGQVAVSSESIDYEGAPGISTLEPERSGWDEF